MEAIYIIGNTFNYEYNPNRAKQILVDNEWEYVWGNWQKKIEYNTIKLKINLVVQGTNESRLKVAEIIKKNLEEIGIPITLTKSTDGIYENYLKNKNYENNEVNKILQELYNISDEKTFKEKYEKLQNKYEQDRPYIGLYFNRQVLIHGKSLSTVVSNNWYNIFYDIENWKRKN